MVDRVVSPHTNIKVRWVGARVTAVLASPHWMGWNPEVLVYVKCRLLVFLLNESFLPNSPRHLPLAANMTNKMLFMLTSSCTQWTFPFNVLTSDLWKDTFNVMLLS